MDARQDTGSMLEEIGNFTELWANQGKGVVFMVDFDMRISEVVGDQRRSRNRKGNVLVEWVGVRDISTFNRQLWHQGTGHKWMGEEKHYGSH